MIFFFAAFGLIIGSFLNVLIAREGTDEGIGGRSRCPTCRQVLAPHDLVPVFSWIALGGRCRYCHVRISALYPLVELLTAGLFASLGFAGLPALSIALGLVIISLCIAIGFYDLRHMLIPDTWSYLFSFVALVFGCISLAHMSDVPLLLFSGFFVAFPLWVLWFVSGGRWMGLGDVKFSLGIGWLLGAYDGLVALLGAFVIGAVVSVFVLIPLPMYQRALMNLRTRLWGANTAPTKKDVRDEGVRQSNSSTSKTEMPVPDTDAGYTMTSEVPFGPFLIISCLIIWFCTIYGIEIPLFL